LKPGISPAFFFFSLSLNFLPQLPLGTCQNTALSTTVPPPRPGPEYADIMMASQLKSTQSRVKKATETTIVIGLDFGTTFTGVAWLSSKRPDNIHTITGWENPSCENGDTAKVPSKIHYGDGTQQGGISYGYATPEGREAIEWFKLLLLKETDLPPAIQNSAMLKGTRTAIHRAKKQPAEAAGDFLGKIWQCTLGQIEAQFGRGFVAAAKLQVVVTHPAIWSSKSAKQLREAVKIAGISKSGTEVNYVAEPEAAALATLMDKDGCGLEVCYSVRG